jgi:hypothetical protein
MGQSGVESILVDDRPDIYTLLQPVADLEGFGLFYEPPEKLLVDRLLDVDPVGGDTYRTVRCCGTW